MPISVKRQEQLDAFWKSCEEALDRTKREADRDVRSIQTALSEAVDNLQGDVEETLNDMREQLSDAFTNLISDLEEEDA